MKIYIPWELLILLMLFSCNENAKSPEKISSVAQQITQPKFQTILDSNQVTGAILIFDENQNTYYSNDFAYAEKGFLPASTFKIPNSLIALETGIVKDTTTIMTWDGVERSVRTWNENMTFKEAFHRSCVPCYQDIAREVGEENMNYYLHIFEYTGMGVKADNIDLFWLVGDSRISPFEQIDFLKRFYHEDIVISERTYDIAKKMMLVKETPNYKMLAKTGLSTDNNAWYVGYVDKGNKIYYFATNINPKGELQYHARINVTLAALKSLGVISSTKLY